MADCSTCKHWHNPEHIGDGDPDFGNGLQGRWADKPQPFASPPHADLKWGHCTAAPEGWDSDIDRSQIKMAVFDGSTYHARLLTRADHLCAEHRPADVPA
jgi:hypothetical protein